MACARFLAFSRLEGMGGGETPYKLAAQADLARFLEAVLSPIIYDEQSLTAGADDAGSGVGRGTGRR